MAPENGEEESSRPGSPDSSTSTDFQDPATPDPQSSPVLKSSKAFETAIELLTDEDGKASTEPREAAGETGTGTADGVEPVGTSTPTKAVDENETLAALAAASSSKNAGESSQQANDDPNAPSFVLVASLRNQITDLTSQVSSLNAKLVSSYTRNGDLEDDIHETRQQRSQLQSRVTELEDDRKRWQREIEVGGWVERDHVQGELQSLMHKVLDETRSRETAVQAHDKLEAEIETLTSSLFSEANKMVAVERFARARAEEKMRSLEESNSVMEGLLAELQENLKGKMEELESREAEVATLKATVGASNGPMEGEQAVDEPQTASQSDEALFSDGKAISRQLTKPSPRPSFTTSPSFLHARQLMLPPRLNTSVVPYHEFVSFVTYLRQLRVTTLSRPPPEHNSSSFSHSAYGHVSARGFGAMAPTPSNIGAPPPPSPAQLLAPHLPLSTHSSQAFVKRCIDEDSDPSLRLDFAPGLGFLSRRTVGTAVLDGTLLIEPTYAGSTLPSSTCALCGTGLERWWTGSELPTPLSQAKANVNQTMRKVLGGSGWSIGNLTGRSSTPTPPSPSSGPSSTTGVDSQPHPPPSPSSISPGQHPPQQIHIFRVNDTSSARYAICPAYCLPRLRAVCEFWGYVRAMERGLLLEEGFHFVGGKGVNGALSDSRNGSQSSLSGRSKSSVNLAEATPAHEGPAPVDRQVVEPVKVVVEVAQETGTEQKDASEQKEDKPEDKASGDEVQATDEATGDSSTTSKDASPRINDSPKLEEPIPSGSAPSSEPTSPVVGHKPPVPKRSGARRPLTPTAGSSTEALNAPLSAAPSTSSAPGVPPKLPPRRDPSAATTPPAVPPRSIAAGAKASELGGTVDAMEIVGGATGWEDRCWAEVVRLKEAIFWTRVAREVDPS